MRTTLSLVLALAISSTAVAQVTIAIDDANASTGTSNAFPFGSGPASSGQTSLHVYSAQALRDRGICTGAVLMDLQVAPSSGTAGTYSAPQAKLEIGHLAVSPPVAGNWTGHLVNPVVAHDLTAGPYTFPWTINTWTSLPGVSTSFFVWDGVSDVGVQYTSAGGATGSFSARRTATQLRHYVAVFNATTNPPTSNGNFAMKVQMTWLLSGPCASRQSYGTGCGGLTLTASADPIPTTAIDMVTSSITPTALFGAVCYGFTPFNPGIPLDSFGMTGCFQHNELLATNLFLPSGAPSVNTPFAVPNFPGVSVQAQAIVFDPTAALTPLGAVSSGGVTLTIGF
jgi:hypothetical protein